MKIFSASYYFLAIFIVWLHGFDAGFFSTAKTDPKVQTAHTDVSFFNPFECKELLDSSVAGKEA